MDGSIADALLYAWLMAGHSAGAMPPHVYFVVSAVFHYLGPAFAVLLFDRVAVLGVAWMRIAAAALVFAVWRRPWKALRGDARRLSASSPPSDGSGSTCPMSSAVRATRSRTPSW